MVYLTLTGRYDWDSSLANGDSNDYSFFYPSVGLSFVFSQMFNMPKGFDFAKLRLARTGVGSGLPPYSVYSDSNRPSVNESGIFQQSRTKPYVNPKPERTTSYEVGLDLRFLGALTLDATWYLSNTYNQTFNVPIPSAAGMGNRWNVQAGNVENTGVELSLGYNKTWGVGFGWRSALTYSYNKNTTKTLIEGVYDPLGNPIILDENNKYASFGDEGAPFIRLTEGGSMSDLYVQKYKWQKEPNGQLYINPKTNAINLITIDEYEKLGPMSAHSYAGFSNSFSYKGIELNVQLRGRFGGYVVSNTQAYLDNFGVSQYSADLRKTTMRLEGRGVLPRAYLKAISVGGGMGDHYVYDATNIRVGEVSLSYTVPRKWLNNVADITVGLIANNVAMLYSKAPFDPEQAAGAGNTYYNGVDFFMVPSTRNLGFNVKMQF